MHQEYLVSYGMTGDFGRFRAESPLALARGERVVVRSGRGVEVGTVLRPAQERHARWMPNTGVGVLLRRAGAADLALLHDRAERASSLLSRGEGRTLELGLPLALLDAEVLFDGRHAVLHHVRWQDCDVRDLVRSLSVEFDLTITLCDLSTPTSHAEDHGCGDCGSGGCGSCGEGGCGSCGAEDTARFASLRTQMDQRRVPLL